MSRDVPLHEATRPVGDLRRLRQLWPHVAEHRRLFALSVIAGLLAQFAVLATAVILARLAGSTVAAGGGPFPVVAVAVLAACVLVAGIATWWEMYLSHDLAYVVLATLRVRVFDRLSRVLPSRLRSWHSGQISSTALSDVERLEWLLAHLIAQVLVTATVVAAGAALAGTIAPQTLLVLAPGAAAIMALPWTTRALADRQGEREREAAAALQTDVVDTVAGLPELAAADALDRRRTELALATTGLTRLSMRGSARAGAESALAELIVSLCSILVLLITVHEVRAGGLGVADAPVLLTLCGAVLLPLGQLSAGLQQSGSLRASLNRIFDVLNSPDSVAEPAGESLTRVRVPVRGAPAVEFRDVGFGYHPDRPVLHAVSFTVEEGETVALVGSSGAGKSTVLALLQRFWDPDQGVIRVAGRDLRDWPDDELRASVAVVEQDVKLFAMSLGENIRLGSPGADAGLVASAVARAQLEPVVARLPDGLRTVVGERGTTLSGGERARVAIARALAVSPRLLVLDEAVAGLDNRTERELHRALAENGSRATLIVAHRPATIARAHRVIVLDDGHVIASGSPEQTRALWAGNRNRR